MAGDFRVAVSQIGGICMIYGPPITFAGHHVLKSCHLTTQIQRIPLSYTSVEFI